MFFEEGLGSMKQGEGASGKKYLREGGCRG